MKLRIAAILIFILYLNHQVEGACKAHDAGWNRGVKPRITQPARGEPDKIVIDWSQAIKNARCVDFYNVYVWKRGQAKDRGQKIVVMDKTKSKLDLVIEPCVDYNFAVEFVERDWTHTDQKTSEEARFKTETIPELLDQDVRNFAVSYYNDPAKGHHVVDKVSIRFRKNIIKHASCVKDIEIKGTVDRTPPKPITKPPVGGSSQTSGRSFFSSQSSQSSQSTQRYVGGTSSTGGFQGMKQNQIMKFNPFHSSPSNSTYHLSTGHGSVGGSSQTGGRYGGGVGGSSQTGGNYGGVGGSSQTGGNYNNGYGHVGGSTQTGGQYNNGHSHVGGSSQTGGKSLFYKRPNDLRFIK